MWKDAVFNTQIQNQVELSTVGDLLPLSTEELPNSRYNRHGFTCTGLAYDEIEDCLWVGNAGLEYPGDSRSHPSLVKMTKNNSIINEVDAFVVEAETKNKDLQGIAFDSKDNVLWVSLGGRLLCVTKDGHLIKKIQIADSTFKVNGIAYDKRNDTLWILGATDYLLNITKSGEVLSRIPCDIRGQDQLTFSPKGQLYITAGIDYHGRNNYLYEFNENSEVIRAKYRLIDSFAVEGCCFIGDKLYVMNDGYYHNAMRKKNEVFIYSLSE